jgi:8-oxo-dGTP diphosphatase
MQASDLAVLLIRRGHPPFEGAWALPGGFVDENEPLVVAAARELREETSLSVGALEQLGAFGDPGRDPRGHTVSVAFYTFVIAPASRVVAGDDAAEVAWHPLGTLSLGHSPRRGQLRLAFDHARIIEAARYRLGERLVAPLEPFRQRGLQLVPAHFTLAELHRVYEAVLGSAIDKRSFHRRLLSRDLVEPVTRTRRARGERLYRWMSPRS